MFFHFCWRRCPGSRRALNVSILHSDITAQDTCTEPASLRLRLISTTPWFRGRFLASLGTPPMKADLSKGSQRLLAQGLSFYKSLWFTSIHHVSCSNVSGSWLIPLNIKRTSSADITNSAWIQLYFLKPLLCPVLLSCSLSVKAGPQQIIYF